MTSFQGTATHQFDMQASEGEIRTEDFQTTLRRPRQWHRVHRSLHRGKGLHLTPLLIVHGNQDTAAPIQDSEVVGAGYEEGLELIDFGVLTGRDHNIAEVYGDAHVFEWVLNHHR